jgi:hypothetical protein
MQTDKFSVVLLCMWSFAIIFLALGVSFGAMDFTKMGTMLNESTAAKFVKRAGIYIREKLHKEESPREIEEPKKTEEEKKSEEEKLKMETLLISALKSIILQHKDTNYNLLNTTNWKLANEHIEAFGILHDNYEKYDSRINL